jgi:PDZ domain-containing protein
LSRDGRCRAVTVGVVRPDEDVEQPANDTSTRPAFRWRRVGSLITVGLVAIVALAVSQLPSTYASYHAGPAPLIEFDDGADITTDGGSWRFTTVSVEESTVLEHIVDTVNGRQTVPAVELDAAERVEAQKAMSSSQEIAWAVAQDLHAGGDGSVPVQVVVSEVVDGSPAEQAGVRSDATLTSIDGTPVDSAEQVADTVKASDGDPVVLGFADGTSTSVTPARSGSSWTIGVTVSEKLPDPQNRPEIDAGSVGGPSAGLLFTLAYLDHLSGGTLTGGRTVAGTGTITGAGEVGPVNGVPYKVDGARSEGADVFFVPTRTNERLDSSDLDVVPVSTAAEAVAWLCDTGGSGRACDRGR